MSNICIPIDSGVSVGRNDCSIYLNNVMFFWKGGGGYQTLIIFQGGAFYMSLYISGGDLSSIFSDLSRGALQKHYRNAW